MKIDRDRFLLGMVLGGLLLVTVRLSEFSVPLNKVADRSDSTVRYASAAASSASMSNIPTLTPSPVPLSGYCLNVPVLLYHHVQPQSQASELGQTSLSVDNEIFEDQMDYLVSNSYTTISAIQLADGLRLHAPLPEKSIVVTFDDGYKDAYTYVYPILQRYKLKANFMIATGLVGGSGYLSWNDIEEMSRSGLAYFVDHTWSHYPLNHGDRAKIKFEIETAKQNLEQHTGQTVNIFAYPFGSFNNDSVEVLKESGFLGAFSTIPGFWQCDSFILTLHRNHIGNAPLSAYGL